MGCSPAALRALRVARTSAERVSAAHALRELARNTRARQALLLRASDECVDVWLSAAHAASTNRERSALCEALAALATPRLLAGVPLAFVCECVRDALVVMARGACRLATADADAHAHAQRTVHDDDDDDDDDHDDEADDACMWIASAIVQLTVRDVASRTLMLGCASMRDVLVVMTRRARSSDAQERVVTVLGRVTTVDNLRCCALYSTPPMFGALRALARRGVSEDVRCSMSTLVHALGSLRYSEALVTGTRDVLTELAAGAASDRAIKEIADALGAMAARAEEVSELLRVAGVSDAFVAMALRATSPLAIESVALALTRLLRGKPEGREALQTEAMRDALVAMAHRSVTDDARKAVALAFRGLSWQSSRGKVLLRTKPVHDVLLAMARDVSEPTALKWIMNAVVGVVQLSPGPSVATFVTEDMRDQLVLIARRTLDEDVQVAFAFAVEALARSEGAAPTRHFASADVRDALVALVQPSTIPPLRLAVARALSAMAGDVRDVDSPAGDALRLLCTEEVCRALLVFSGRSSDAATRSVAAALMSSIARLGDSAAARLLCTSTVRDALVDMAAGDTRGATALAFRYIVSLDTDGRTFRTAAVRDALVEIVHKAESDEATENAARALCSLAVHDWSNRQFLCTPSLGDALVAAAGRTQSLPARLWLSSLAGITQSGGAGQRVVHGPAVRASLAAMQVATSDAKCWLWMDGALSAPPAASGDGQA